VAVLADRRGPVSPPTHIGSVQKAPTTNTTTAATSSCTSKTGKNWEEKQSKNKVQQATCHF